MRGLLIAIGLIGAFGCRNDDGVESALQWSCAQVKGQRDPVVTPECLAQMRKEGSIVLSRYAAEPRMVDGKVDHYLLLEKKAR